MSKTTVNNFIALLKRRFDYNITDTDLDTLLIDVTNDSIKLAKQWFDDSGIIYDVTGQSSFQTIPGQAYKDLTQAVIVGDIATFTGIANDKIKVSIDGTTYDNISIATATTIALVATAINTAVGSTVAYANATSGTLEIRSLTTGASSTVTIADGGTTGQTVVGDLFSTATDRTATGITDVDDIVRLTERVNETSIPIFSYADFISAYPDPTSEYAVTPQVAARFNNYIYFGPTPSSYTRIYIDYIKFITEVAAGGTMPFDNKYDPVLMAQARLEFLLWQDPSNATAITAAKALRDQYKQELIVGASRNRDINLQSYSRNESDFIGPQIPESGDFSAG